jgi:SAM-dependent methyltransferase
MSSTDQDRRRRIAEAGYRLFRARQEASGQTEQQRLALFEQCFDPITRHNLSAIPVRTGWNILEVAAGRGSVAEWLMARVGSKGSVTATDLAYRSNPSNEASAVRYVRHDAVNDPFPRSTYDCTHVRSALHLMPARNLVLSRLVESLVPGGCLLVEEIDIWPALQAGNNSYSQVFSKLQECSSSVGIDLTWVRHLPSHLASAGISDLRIRSVGRELVGGSLESRLWSATLRGVKELLLQSGLSPDVFKRAMNELNDPSFRTHAPALVTALGYP